MSTYQGTFDKTIPGLRFIDRSAEGFLDIVYDNCFDPVPPRQYDCGPYVLTITKDGAPFQVVPVSNHFYGSCWWYELVPVTTIVRDAASLISNGYVPPIGKTAIPFSLPVAGSVKFPGIMKLSSDITGGEASTGGRPEIGIVTTNVAQALLTGDWRNALEDAKDTATQPIWSYDNGKPIDLLAKPLATNYDTKQGGTPFWLGPHPAAPTNPGTVFQPSIPDTGHMAELCGVVALATGAPRYVRALQMRVIRGFNETNYWAAQWGAVTVWRFQSRGIAWLLRQLFDCYWATLLAEQAGNLPADCLPSSNFKTIIDNQVTLFNKFVEPSAPFQNFGLVQDQSGIVAWWQVDMINQVLGLYAQKWPTVWGPIYIKVLRNLAARTNADGLKQWPVAMPTWYWGAIGPYVNGNYGGKPYSGYAELLQTWYASQVAGVDIAGRPDFLWLKPTQVTTLNTDPTNGGKFIHPTEYESWAYGALAFAVYLDRGALKGAVSAAYPRLEQAFTDFNAMMLKGYSSFIAPCSFSVTPQTTNPQPPAGALHMSNTGNLAIGQSQRVALTFDDGRGNASQAPVNLAYAESPPGVVSVSADATGAVVTGLLAGSFTITATADNCAPVSVSGVVVLPLAASLHLAWG